jgi:hypothetical protein
MERFKWLFPVSKSMLHLLVTCSWKCVTRHELQTTRVDFLWAWVATTFKASTDDDDWWTSIACFVYGLDCYCWIQLELMVEGDRSWFYTLLWREETSLPIHERLEPRKPLSHLTHPSCKKIRWISNINAIGFWSMPMYMWFLICYSLYLSKSFRNIYIWICVKKYLII